MTLLHPVLDSYFDAFSEPIFAPDQVQGAITSPAVFGDALAGVAGDVAGELALEGRRHREAVQPLDLGAPADQRRIRIAACAVDDEARTGQRLEHGGDRAVGIVIMCPCGAAAQR